MKKTVSGELADQLVSEFPNATTHSLTRILRKKHPAVYTSDNMARNAIRRVRGGSGKHNNTYVTKPRTKAKAADAMRWQGMMPPAEPNAWGWKRLPDGVKCWLVLADLHIPYHDEEAIDTALEFAAGKCDGVLLLGDVADAYQLSPWLRDPRQRRFSEEVNAVTQFLDMLSQWGAKQVVWKMGNHEYRLERYLQSRAAELFGMDQFTFTAFCDLKRRGIPTVDAMDPIRVGKLTLMHGHEFGTRFSSPVNPARGTYLKAKDCVLVGHEHRTSEHTEPTLSGVTVTCWSVGALCDLHPRYRPLNSWNHGFAVLDLSGKEWSVRNYRIVNGTVL